MQAKLARIMLDLLFSFSKKSFFAQLKTIPRFSSSM